MKRESHRGHERVVAGPRADPETVALRVFERLAAEPARMGRFLASSGLDLASLRTAAGSPDFLPAILDHVVQDEALLVELAGETGLKPEEVAEAQRRLSPPEPWDS